MLDEQKTLFKKAILDGCYIHAYIADNIVMSSTFIPDKKSTFDFKKIYEECKFDSHPNFEDLTKIEVFDYHYKLLGQYTSSCKSQD